MKRSTSNWLKVAFKDLKIAKICIKEDEPLNAIFHMHACVEKTLKGLAEEKGLVPPKIHSLKKLAVEVCELRLEKHQNDLLNLLDKAFIGSRYPDEVERFEEEYDIERCLVLANEVEAAIKWLKNLIEAN
ncbi:MAG: HEPN domain-containing protein [Candidatus Caenarcaniphilales bacterium]|jgi:HEPN domain-containing protein|nr:HEPN domain-containing protein [Candidatus Caenarcaniphilales bacterium]